MIKANIKDCISALNKVFIILNIKIISANILFD